MAGEVDGTTVRISFIGPVEGEFPSLPSARKGRVGSSRKYCCGENRQ